MPRPVGNRRHARELALQALYCIDSLEFKMSVDTLNLVYDLLSAPRSVRPFTDRLIYGVVTHRVEIDRLIENFASNWKMKRIPMIDRNITRISLYEMLWCDDVPDTVAINEAVEIGKRYGTEESAGFINGLLDNIHREYISKIEKPKNSAQMPKPPKGFPSLMQQKGDDYGK